MVPNRSDLFTDNANINVSAVLFLKRSNRFYMHFT